MKNILFLFSLILCFISCDEDFLNEEPQDFFSASNAYVTYEDFNASVNNLYYLVRRQFYSRDENRPFDFLYGTDIVYDGENNGIQRHSRVEDAYDPISPIPTTHWNLLYKTISETNAIINRAEDSEMTEEEKVDILAQARFFRAFSYRSLVYLYGDVPLITEEIQSPRTDFTRTPTDEVMNQIVEDLNYAAESLPEIGEATDGRINNLVAYNYLAEVYLYLERPLDAIAAANEVINNPNTALMQDRFGSRADETPGDVYWDLFRRGNQNRSSGNRESLWVIQFELDLQGGGLQSGSRAESYMLERQHAPFIRDVVLSDGDRPFYWPTGDYTGGRGIGWMISNVHFSNTVWGGDSSNPDFVNDIRNANHNFVRVYDSENSVSLSPGESISTENPPEGIAIPSRPIYAYQSKATTPFNHPDGLYENSETYALTAAAGGTYTDQYMLRLPETYFLRAEAYLANGQPGLAAEDINMLRSRANASPATADQIDIDYILDERIREFGVEEKRRFTLMRLGLLYDRVVRFNPYYVEQGMREAFNLWPIPANEIERNRSGNLEQNPGYN